MKVIDNGGTVLTRAKVVLSYRGAGWGDGVVAPGDAKLGFQALLASPYFSHLVQYRGIRRPEIVFETAVDTSNLGTLGPDPRGFVPGNVWLITDEDFLGVVKQAVKARPPRAGEEIFYFVVVSQDPVQVAVSSKDANGFHTASAIDGRSIPWGMALNQSANGADAQLSYLPGVFGHELVEACTDPQPPSGFVTDAVDGDNELCDLDDERQVELPGLGRTLALQAYWSELAGAAVAPTTYSVRVALGRRRADPVPSVRALLGGGSVRAAILARCDA